MTAQKIGALALLLGGLFTAVLLTTLQTRDDSPHTELSDDEARLFAEDDAESFGEPVTEMGATSSEAHLLAIRQREDGRLEALITDLNGVRYYVHGDRLAGGAAELAQILDNAVLLRKGAVYQLLCCTAATVVERSGHPTVPTVVDLRSHSETTLTLRRYYSRLFQNPISLVGKVEIETSHHNGSRFYHVFPGSDVQAFSDFGLQAGDRILGINGVDLADKNALPKVFEALAAASQFAVTVQRDGRELVLLLALDGNTRQSEFGRGALL